MNDDISKIADKIFKGGKNIIFTGAGISTESGIPDYRSKGGLWKKFTPIYFDDFMDSKDARIEYWRRKLELYNDLINAKPNNAHMSVFNIYKMGLIDTVITQNIDGLHQKSGIPDKNIIELHGNTLRVRCMSCYRVSSIYDAYKCIKAGDLAPECKCGGYLKPDTISFGQSMPEKEVQAAVKLSQNADFFMVVGSTLLVQPAAGMPALAKKNGAFLAMINMSKTSYNKIFDILIYNKAGTALTDIKNTISRLAG
jgi:NAD-dependent deacetylase